MAFHLLSIPVIGYYAVFSFFVLSGFLMTTIMQDSYGYTLNGIKSYALNRFLRLYPSYWLAIAISILVIFYCGPAFVSLYKTEIRLPQQTTEIFANLTMIFPAIIPHSIQPRLSPPTWALTVELCYYVIIALGASKSLRNCWIWFSASVVYVVLTYINHMGWDYRYAAIPAGSLPFSVGALLYFYKNAINDFLKNKILAPISSWIILSFYLANSFIFTVLAILFKSNMITTIGLYLNIPITCLVIIRLYYSGLTGLSKNIDKKIGDFSYPIYLLHWQIGALASFIVLHKPVTGSSLPSLLSFSVAFIFVIIASSFIIYGLDPFIEKIRTHIREKIVSQRSPANMVKPIPTKQAL